MEDLFKVLKDMWSEGYSPDDLVIVDISTDPADNPDADPE